MYTILHSEFADVDESLFTQIGIFTDSVVAVPILESTIALKGLPRFKWDNPTDCQNSIYFTLDIEPSKDPGNVNFDQSLIPGRLFRYNGEETQYQNEEFVELHHEVKMGLLSIIAYFLIPTTDCEFAVHDESGIYVQYSMDYLCEDGFVVKDK